MILILKSSPFLAACALLLTTHAGALSPRAKEELENRGFVVTQNAFISLAQ